MTIKHTNKNSYSRTTNTRNTRVQSVARLQREWSFCCPAKFRACRQTFFCNAMNFFCNFFSSDIPMFCSMNLLIVSIRSLSAVDAMDLKLNLMPLYHRLAPRRSFRLYASDGARNDKNDNPFREATLPNQLFKFLCESNSIENLAIVSCPHSSRHSRGFSALQQMQLS